MWTILVLIIDLFVTNAPTHDSIRLTHLNNKPLNFQTYQQCRAHVEKNIVEIIKYSENHFYKNHERLVICVKNNKEVWL
tara:strand:- start:129 stop:365 length:237 start_codon:yes stop_codon:yes gene_type:complete